MNAVRNAILVAACLVAGTAWAQGGSAPLNLQLPPSDLPVAAATVAAPPARQSTSKPATPPTTNPTSPPGVYYGDTSGRVYGASRHVAAQRCDDATYNQPQVHGSASLGVMAGNHVSGSYQAGTFSVTRNLGDCEHPTGGIGFSISVGQSRFHGRGW